MTTAADQPAENVIALPGMPELPSAPVEPNAGHLVAAWCSAWSSTHNGAQPDPTVVRRVAGVCRSIAKDRTDLDSWRDAWHAAKAAGARGRFDIVGELCAPVVTSNARGNHFLAIAREQSVAAQLDAAITPLQISS